MKFPKASTLSSIKQTNSNSQIMISCVLTMSLNRRLSSTRLNKRKRKRHMGTVTGMAEVVMDMATDMVMDTVMDTVTIKNNMTLVTTA